MVNTSTWRDWSAFNHPSAMHSLCTNKNAWEEGARNLVMIRITVVAEPEAQELLVNALRFFMESVPLFI